MRRTLKLSMVVLGVVVAGGGLLAIRTIGGPGATTTRAVEAGAKYRCPMHPAYVSDEPAIARSAG